MSRRRAAKAWKTREESSLLLKCVLWGVDRLERPLSMVGVDPLLLRRLLHLRVVLDLRPNSPMGESVGLTGTVLWALMFWGAGLFTGIVAVVSQDTTLWVTASLSTHFLLLLLFLLQALVSQLLDPMDVHVLASHPVPDRTLFAARLVHVTSYLVLFTVCFLLGNLMLAVIRQPPVPTLLVFPLLAGASAVTALGSVACFFGALLRIVGPSHFQRVALWVQVLTLVVATAGLQVGAQLASRVVTDDQMERLWASDSSWKLLWPPEAYPRVFELALGEVSQANLMGLASVLLLPVASLAIAVRLASRSFVAALEGGFEMGSTKNHGWPSGLFDRLGQRLCSSEPQRAGYGFALSLGRREPHLLRGVLPQALSQQGMVLAICLRDFMEGDRPTLFVPLSAGIFVLSLPVLLEMSQHSQSKDAKWLFKARPVDEVGEHELMRGGVKGLFVSWYAAGMVLVLALQLVIVGPSEILSILLALALSILIALEYTRRWKLGVPFTQSARKATGTQNIGVLVAMMLTVGVAVGLQLLLGLHALAQLAGIVVTALFLRRSWRGLDSMQVPKGMRL